jgi:hypothetical protein
LSNSVVDKDISQLFLGTENNVYIIVKVENNPKQINGHPAWASGTSCGMPIITQCPIPVTEYTLSDNSQRPMEVLTDIFCAVRTFSCS